MITRIAFASIPVDDMARARDFYRDRLGMRVSVDQPEGPMPWVMLDIPGAATRLHLDDTRTVEPGGRPAIPLIGADVAEVTDRLRAEGVEIVRDPGAAEWDASVTYALIRDSEGNIVLIASG